ncbi:hypothetical protein ACP275_01G078500 [Erythranthe tilingii]
MPSWWKSSKEVKKKSNMQSIIGSLHMQCIRPISPRRRCSDITPEKRSELRAYLQSPSPSKKVSRCQSFGERPKSQPLPLPLPKPGHVKIVAHAVIGEGNFAVASNSSDTSSDTDDPSDSRLLSPEASDYESGLKSDTSSPSGLKQRGQSLFTDKRNAREMSKPANILLNMQRPLNSKVAHLQIPHHVGFLSAPDSSMSSPRRSPMRLFSHEHVTNRCSPECSPLPSPRITSPCPSSRIHSGAVTPLHSRAVTPTSWLDDGRKQSHPLPLPPVSVSSPPPITPSFSAGASPRIPRSPTSPGSHWKKGRLLGRGTFGHVYLGFSSENGEMCAMKEVTLFSNDAKSKECAQQLGHEVAFLSRLHHPNIVQYYGSETVDDKLYIYLEYVSGGSIYKILQDYGQLGEAAIRSYTQQILSGLAYLHRKNTLHRDIKGANILVDPNGRVKLADFGMAKHITGPSCPLSFKGSPYWMAPEVVKNSSGCNLAVDIWSLGCTVLEMATTKPPWSQYEGVAALFKIGNSKELPEIPDSLSDECKDFVRQCLQRNPCYRPTAAQLLEHPFIKKSTLSERHVSSAEPTESMPALTHKVRALDKKEQLYDAHLALADRVSQQLLKNPVRPNPGLKLSPKSPMSRNKNGF